MKTTRMYLLTSKSEGSFVLHCLKLFNLGLIAITFLMLFYVLPVKGQICKDYFFEKDLTNECLNPPLTSVYWNKYYKQTYNIPSSHTWEQPKTILVNIIVWRKDDGTGNAWTPANENRLYQIINNVSSIYESNDTPSDPIPGVDFVPDTKIRFKLNYVYYYNNTLIYSEPNIDLNSLTKVKNYLNQNNPEALNCLNINIIGGSYCNASGFAQGDSRDQMIFTFNTTAYPDGDWAFAGHLAHELGYSLGLKHPYYTEGDESATESCQISSYDFLDDVFGSSRQPWCNLPPSSSCDVCYHDAGFSCDPFSISNNVQIILWEVLQVQGIFLQSKLAGCIVV